MRPLRDPWSPMTWGICVLLLVVLGVLAMPVPVIAHGVMVGGVR